MIVAPIPVTLPLALRRVVPINGRVMPLLPIHMPRAVFVVIPLVVILVVSVVKPVVVVVMIMVMIMILRK